MEITKNREYIFSNGVYVYYNEINRINFFSERILFFYIWFKERIIKRNTYSLKVRIHRIISVLERPSIEKIFIKFYFFDDLSCKVSNKIPSNRSIFSLEGVEVEGVFDSHLVSNKVTTSVTLRPNQRRNLRIRPGRWAELYWARERLLCKGE